LEHTIISSVKKSGTSRLQGAVIVGEIINLNKARKERERAEKDQKAKENRALSGQSGAQKKSLSSALDKLRRSLDGSRLETPETPPRPPRQSS
jgi:hypothetical protein